MKRIFTLLLLAVISFAVTAQDNPLMKKINSLGSVQMTYSLSIDNQDGKSIMSQSGTLYYQDGAYRLESTELQIICDGKSRWVYSKSSEEVVIMKNDYQSASVADNPLLLLSSSKVKDNGNGTFSIIYTDDKEYHYIVKVSALKQSEKHPSSFFVLDENGLGDDVIVTDLR